MPTKKKNSSDFARNFQVNTTADASTKNEVGHLKRGGEENR